MEQLASSASPVNQPAPLAGEEQTGAPSQTPLPPLWRQREYMLLWSGQLVSVMGTGISGIALPLLVLALTHSPAQAGLVEGVFALPYVVFSLPAGALVDRWDRKKVMMLCDSGQAILMGGIAFAYLLGHLSMAQIYASALVGGSLFVFFNLAEVAALPRVVAKEQLPSASAQNEAAQSTSLLVAPPLGGFLFGTVGAAVPFLADAVSYAASVISLAFIRTHFQRERVEQPGDLRREILEGIRWLWHQPLVLFMAFLTGGLNFTGSAIALILIVLAQRQGAPAGVIGLMFSIGSIGALAGAMVAPRFQRRFGFGQVIIVTVWIGALLWPLFDVAPNPFALGAVFAGMAVTGPIYNAVQFSYRLAIIPDELQGRVNSAFRLLAFGGQPLGATLGGIFIQTMGPKPAVLVFAAVSILLAAAATANPLVRHARLGLLT